jgi:serine/threonine protein kinase
MQEVNIHKSITHENIVRFIDYFEDSESYYIVLELCNEENLETRLAQQKVFTEEQVVLYIRQLCLAVKHLHDHKIIHRDLKLANLFLKNGTIIKLGDFGLACKHDSMLRKRKSVCGTPNYITPEMLSGEGHSFPVDVWAIGILLYAMLVGKPPFETSNVRMTYNRIQTCMYVFPPEKPINIEAKTLIQKILAKNPAKRPSINEILESPFLLSASPAPEDHPALPTKETPKSPLSRHSHESKGTHRSRNDEKKAHARETEEQSRSGKVLLKENKAEKEESLSGKENQFKKAKEGTPVPEEKPISATVEKQGFLRRLMTNEYVSKPDDPYRTDEGTSTPDHHPKHKHWLKPDNEGYSSHHSRYQKPVMNTAENKEERQADLKQEPQQQGGLMKKKLFNSLFENPSEAQEPEHGYGYMHKEALKEKEKNNTELAGKRRKDSEVDGGTKGSNDDSTTIDKPKAKKINAFDIIKNTSKVASHTNSILEHKTDQKEPVREKAEAGPGESSTLSRRDLRRDANPDHVRDSSATSQNSTNKKYFFQRLQRESEVKEEPASKPNLEESQNQDSFEKQDIKGDKSQKQAAAGVRSTSMVPRLVDENNLHNRLASFGNARRQEPAGIVEAQPVVARAPVSDTRRTNSAQPTVKFKSLWKKSEQEEEEEEFNPKDHVKKWIDHSKKYGLIFIMQSGTLGILFNDHTKMIFKLHGE